MTKLIVIILIFISNVLVSQQINIKDYGAKGDGKTDNSAIFEKINKELDKFIKQKKHTTIYIPIGCFVITKPIKINKYISLEGEDMMNSVIKVNTPNSEAILVENNRNESDIYNYTFIRNLNIQGPDYKKNYSEWKNKSLNNPKSVGIKVLGIRNKISNCLIEGFLWSGIEFTGSYYNYFNENFVKNNRVGITINNTSTSCFITNNEIRENSIGIYINNNSYANQINNNIIENNISNFLDIDNKTNNTGELFTGTAILISNSFNNFINNNYFEQHYNNIVFNVAKYNNIHQNFFALGNVNAIPQNILKFNGKSVQNKISDNTTLKSKEGISDVKIQINNEDLSSNSIDFGFEKNLKIINDMKNSKNASSFLPKIKN